MNTLATRFVWFSLLSLAACGSESNGTPDAGTPDTSDTSIDTTIDTDATDAAEDAETGNDVADAVAPSPGSGERGPYAAGVQVRTWTDATRERALPVAIWYPAEGDVAATIPIATLLQDAEQRATYEGLLGTAPADCPSRTVQGVNEATAATAPAGGWPVVVYSHCHNCLGLSGATVASHLASHGFVVLAPDHVGNTLFDGLADASMPLNADTLAMRVADLTFVLDTALEGNAELVGDGLAGMLDATRVGAAGHSFGAVSVAGLTASDDRIVAVVPMGAPPESPLFPGVFLADIDAPMMLVLLTEDNSITEVGNTLMRDNFEAATSPVWKLEIVDAGHGSVSDLCGIAAAYMPGCGEDNRQTNPRETFNYIPVADGLAIAAEWTTRFLRAHVRNEPEATAELAAEPAAGLLLDARNP